MFLNQLATEMRDLFSAYEKAKQTLLDERCSAGHWIGELATSALSTATAVSALTLVERHRTEQAADAPSDERLSQLIVGGIEWLADHQNDDGGWGDTDQNYSNIATTMLAVAAFHLTGVPSDHTGLLERAEEYIDKQGRIAGLRKRYGKDKTFAVPILTNCALAGIVPWSAVSPLPFEFACFPQSFYRFLRLPVVSYAIPALVAIGQARYFHKKPVEPVTRFIRGALVERSLKVLERMQPASGGYLEAVPLTSFVVMSLASTGRADHNVTRNGVDFLVESVREDGSWPIDTNLATWNTSQALNALGGADVDLVETVSSQSRNWLLDCQYRDVHPFTGADPGGWGWSDLSGAVPDADDTPGALLAIGYWAQSPACTDTDRDRLHDAAKAGIDWLLDLQNSDGGWPTFCRGWGKLPFDRSGTDLTAHALRAFHAWREPFNSPQMTRAIDRGQAYLQRTQQDDGSWIPLWFGNQDVTNEENPVYGTSKVLMAYRDLGMIETSVAQRGLEFLRVSQNSDGGWGGGPALEAIHGSGNPSSVEETALALEALLPMSDHVDFGPTVERGVDWLVEAVDTDRYLQNSPIGFYFAKLWYHERLYPLIFTVSALGRATQRPPSRPPRQPSTTAHPDLLST